MTKFYVRWTVYFRWPCYFLLQAHELLHVTPTGECKPTSLTVSKFNASTRALHVFKHSTTSFCTISPIFISKLHKTILYVWPCHHLWLCAARWCRRTATELFLVAASRVWNSFHTTSRLHSHCMFSAVAWRLISSDAVFLDYSVVPAKWHLSLWTH